MTAHAAPGAIGTLRTQQEIISPSRHLVHAGVIPSLKLGHKLVLFQPSKVEKALAKRQVKEISAWALSDEQTNVLSAAENDDSARAKTNASVSSATVAETEVPAAETATVNYRERIQRCRRHLTNAPDLLQSGTHKLIIYRRPQHIRRASQCKSFALVNRGDWLVNFRWPETGDTSTRSLGTSPEWFCDLARIGGATPKKIATRPPQHISREEPAPPRPRPN